VGGVEANEFRPGIGALSEQIQQHHAELAGQIDLAQLPQQRLTVMTSKLAQNRPPKFRKLNAFAAELREPSLLCLQHPLHRSFLLRLTPAGRERAQRRGEVKLRDRVGFRLQRAQQRWKGGVHAEVAQ